MKLAMLGWESQGLRCPDMRIDLTQSGKVPKVSLVQMPNGTGKTTTLALIMAALNGSAADWPSAKIRQYRRAGETNDRGRFILRLLVDEEPLTFELSFDFLEDSITYGTTAPSKGGFKQGWNPPTEIRRFLNDRFVNLFIFDGELAQNLLDSSQTKASQAIDTLCQLEHLSKISEAAKANWLNETRFQGAKTPTGLANWTARERKISARLDEVKALRGKLVKDREGIERELKELTQQLAQHLKYDQQVTAKKKKLEDEQAELDSSFTVLARELLLLARQPQYLSPFFAGGLATLKDQFDRVKLPESTSKQFFNELAEEAYCICGRTIGDIERQAILEHGSHYLANELYAFINVLKGDIKQNVIDTEQQGSGRISAVLGQLRDVRRALGEINTELAEIESASITEAGGVAPELSDRRDFLTAKLKENAEEIEALDEPTDPNVSETSWSIKALQIELDRITSKIAEITNTMDLKEKIDTIVQVAESTKEIARNRLRAAIRNDCNSRLQGILSDPIQIDKIGQSLQLKNQDGASVGQTLAVGYTFLSTLLNRGAHKFPLVVDSPAGPLDDHVRNQIGRMIPELCDQFVAFTISTEREHFLPALEAAAKDSIVYITAFRPVGNQEQLVAGLPSHAEKSDDGVVVTGRDYFVDFIVPQESD